MTLRAWLARLIALQTLATVALAAAGLGWAAWRVTLERAREEATLAAQLLARIAAVSARVSDEAGAMVGDALATQAYLVAQMDDLAGLAGLGPDRLAERLREAAARTDLDEVWVSDGTGAPVASSLDQGDAAVAAEDAVIEDLVDRVRGGTRFATTTGAVRPELDRADMAYAGVRRLGEGGVVLAGRRYGEVRELGERFGARDALDLIRAGGAIDGVWLTDEGASVVAGSAPAGAEPDLALARLAAGRGAPVAALRRGGALAAAAPILDADGLPSGAVLVSLSRRGLVLSLAPLGAAAGGAALAALALGLAAAAAAARRVARPAAALARAAREVEAGRFEPASLDGVADRPDEIGRLGRAFRDMAAAVATRELETAWALRAQAGRLADSARALEAARGRAGEGLAAAGALQAATLPLSFVPDPPHALHARVLPAAETRGAFCDAFRIDGRRFGFLVADASGRGVTAALFMAAARSLLRDHGREGLPPGECLRRANLDLCHANPAGLSATVLYGVLDTGTGGLAYASGGHPAPHLLRPAGPGPPERLPGAGGPALGLDERAAYPDRVAALAPGDTLVLLTKGVASAAGPAGEPFGDARAAEALARARHQPLPELVRRLTAAAERFGGGPPPADDMACLAVRFGPAG